MTYALCPRRSYINVLQPFWASPDAAARLHKLPPIWFWRTPWIRFYSSVSVEAGDKFGFWLPQKMASTPVMESRQAGDAGILEMEVINVRALSGQRVSSIYRTEPEHSPCVGGGSKPLNGGRTGTGFLFPLSDCLCLMGRLWRGPVPWSYDVLVSVWVRVCKGWLATKPIV